MQAEQLNVTIKPLKPILTNSAQKELQVLIRIAVKAEVRESRTPLSVALVLDRSGSMRGARLEAAKEAVKHFIDQLNPNDEVCLVTYDEQVSIPLLLTKVRDLRPLLPEILSSISSGGSTNLHAGWLEGAQQLAPQSGGTRMCRVVLLSDGKANAGLKGVRSICEQVSQLAAAGITTTTVGIGLDFNEYLMAEIAIAGHGAAMYGDRAEDLIEPLESEVELINNLVWHDVSLEIHGEFGNWTIHNSYTSIGPGQWMLPSIANQSEAWMALSIPMPEAIAAQTDLSDNSALQISIKAKNANCNVHVVRASLPQLPVVSPREFNDYSEDELVRRRFVEIEAAEIKRQAYRAAGMSQWARLSQLIDQLETKANDNPWLSETVIVLRRLLESRDQARLEKELMYASHSLSSRLTELDEGISFSQRDELNKAAFLRRKNQQGRRSGSGI